MFRASAVAEVSGQLGKSLVKFCSGDSRPEGLLPDTQLLDPLLKETSTAPLAQPPGKGMDGELVWGVPLLNPTLSPPPTHPSLWSQHLTLSLRSTLLHLHIRDHGAAQGCYRRAQQVWGPWVLSPVRKDYRSSVPPDHHPASGSCWVLVGVLIPTQ